MNQMQSWAMANTTTLTDEQVRIYLHGHALWDDPPDGWTEKELLIWSRGYLYGRSIQACNDMAEMERAAAGKRRG